MMLGALLALAWSYSCLSFAAHLKTRFRLRSGYTRKLFHVLIFISAAVVSVFGGFWAVCVFGVMVSLVVGLAIFRGQGDGFYEALAREQDGPDRTYYIVVPYFATLIGGMTSNVIFGPLAVMGYLVGGLGDAAGEPAGVRWGRHRYTSSGGVIKTLEGSLAVLAASLVALAIGVAVSPSLASICNRSSCFRQSPLSVLSSRRFHRVVGTTCRCRLFQLCWQRFSYKNEPN